MLGEENTKSWKGAIPANDAFSGVEFILYTVDFLPSILREGDVGTNNSPKSVPNFAESTRMQGTPKLSFPLPSWRKFVEISAEHCKDEISCQIREPLHQEFKCLGCGALVHTAVETTWYYRLNTLVRRAIVEHGTVALIGALAAAREEARNSFLYSPGLVFYERYEDREAVADIDTICLIDGGAMGRRSEN
jgi:hypothetical protein